MPITVNNKIVTREKREPSSIGDISVDSLSSQYNKVYTTRQRLTDSDQFDSFGPQGKQPHPLNLSNLNSPGSQRGKWLLQKDMKPAFSLDDVFSSEFDLFANKDTFDSSVNIVPDEMHTLRALKAKAEEGGQRGTQSWRNEFIRIALEDKNFSDAVPRELASLDSVTLRVHFADLKNHSMYELLRVYRSFGNRELYENLLGDFLGKEDEESQRMSVWIIRVIGMHAPGTEIPHRKELDDLTHSEYADVRKRAGFALQQLAASPRLPKSWYKDVPEHLWAAVNVPMLRQASLPLLCTEARRRFWFAVQEAKKEANAICANTQEAEDSDAIERRLVEFAAKKGPELAKLAEEVFSETGAVVRLQNGRVYVDSKSPVSVPINVHARREWGSKKVRLVYDPESLIGCRVGASFSGVAKLRTLSHEEVLNSGCGRTYVHERVHEVQRSALINGRTGLYAGRITNKGKKYAIAESLCDTPYGNNFSLDEVPAYFEALLLESRLVSSLVASGCSLEVIAYALSEMNDQLSFFTKISSAIYDVSKIVSDEDWFQNPQEFYTQTIELLNESGQPVKIRRAWASSGQNELVLDLCNNERLESPLPFATQQSTFNLSGRIARDSAIQDIEKQLYQSKAQMLFRQSQQWNNICSKVNLDITPALRHTQAQTDEHSAQSIAEIMWELGTDNLDTAIKYATGEQKLRLQVFRACKTIEQRLLPEVRNYWLWEPKELKQ